jgi:tryptophanyl-tRNA synthetase
VQLQQQHTGAIFCVVDYHAITGNYEPAVLRQRRWDMACRCWPPAWTPRPRTVFMQSDVPEHTELSWIFTTFTPLGELERQTQFKDKSGGRRASRPGCSCTPCCRRPTSCSTAPTLVPVGEDQVQHLELSRDIARKWNARFGRGFLPRAQAQADAHAPHPGLDGRPRCRSRWATRWAAGERRRDLGEAATGQDRPGAAAQDRPGHPDVCNIFQLHKAFSPAETVQAEVARSARSAGWGCMDCKKVLHAHMDAELVPIRGARRRWRRSRRGARCAGDGARRTARGIAQETMREVRERMGLDATRRGGLAGDRWR